jgi:hypothetical protein
MYELKNKRSWITQIKYGLLYVVLSLIIGEYHPFSRETMYDSFPNLAIVCYLRNSQGEIVPVKKKFHYTADNITHNYWNILEKIADKNKEMSLKEVGANLWTQIAPHAYHSTILDGLAIHRISFFIRNDSIIQNDEILYQVP